MLVLVRHGQTATNADGRLLGRADPPLTAHGRAQAEAVAASLGPVRRVVSSPLVRTRETAAAVAARAGLDVEVDERWIEIDYGALDGTRLADVPADVWDRWRSDPAWTPPGGEALVAVAERVRAACDDLVGDAASGDVVVVSHVSPIKSAVAWALGVDVAVSWRMFLDVASICRIETSGRAPSLRAYNERPAAGLDR